MHTFTLTKNASDSGRKTDVLSSFLNSKKQAKVLPMCFSSIKLCIVMNACVEHWQNVLINRWMVTSCIIMNEMYRETDNELTAEKN